MNERMGESLSALMDDEANEFEIERVLAQIGKDPELRRSWIRYNQVRDAAHGQRMAYAALDISEQVRAALVPSESVSGIGESTSLKQRVLRPLTSFAVAASVAATVVIGGQQLAQVGGADVDRFDSVATSASPVGMLNSFGATAVRASYGMQAIPVLQPAAREAYDELAEQRLHRYIQEHAEQAALNSPQGLVPFARVPQIRE